MAKVALITDTHAGIRNDHPALLTNFKRSHRWFFDEIAKRDIGPIIHLGDVYDRRRYTNTATAAVARNYWWRPLSDGYQDAFVICGNHDAHMKTSNNVNTLQEYAGDRFPKINVINEAAEIIIDGLKILLVPWMNEENHQSTTQFILQSTADVVMGHLELQGFEMYRNVIMNKGDDPKLFSKFKQVFTGHFHHRSSIGNIQYIGALGEYDWSDAGNPRGFSILDTKTLDVEFVQNPHTMFHVLEYDDSPMMDFSPYHDKFVKVVVGKKTKEIQFEQWINALQDAEPCDLSIDEGALVIDDGNGDEVELDGADTQTFLDAYIGALKFPVDNSRVKDYMRGVYKDALEIQ